MDINQSEHFKIELDKSRNNLTAIVQHWKMIGDFQF